MTTRRAANPVWRVVCAWFVLAGFLATSCTSRLSSVVPSVSPPAEDEEVRISRDFRREAKKYFKFVSHPEVERYIDRLGRRILAVSGPLPYDYRFFVIEDSQLNAFAVPGGSIYFYSGLIERARTTSEIAGVLGHEIIHIKGRHMARSSGPDAISVLSLIGMILLARSGGAQAAGTVGQAISASRQIAYGRQLELEADTLGARYMTSAGFDPNGALGFLKMLEEERALNPIDIPAYLMSHPVTSERVANMQQVIRSLSNPSVNVEEPDPLKKIQIILRTERGDGAAALSAYEKLATEKPDSAEILYLLGFARQLRGQLAQAQQSMERALDLSPNNPALLRDLGRLYTQLGNTDKAEVTLNRALELQPREPLTYLYLGELYEKRNDFRSAVGAYLNAHTLSPLWDRPPQLLSNAYGKLDRLGDAYYYLGRSLLLQDEDEKAFAALEKAAKIVGANSPRGQLIGEELKSLRARRK